MSAPTREQVLADLAGLLRDFNGKEYSGPIGPDILFFGDLGLVSIDAVVLGETLEKFYGQRFPFSRFLADLGTQGVQDIALGKLAEFLHQHLKGRE